MVRALILGLMLVTACGSSESGPSPSGGETTGKDVGKVAEVSGTVTATRDGKARTLAVGSPVVAADVIDTGKDGSIVIELFHNNARWSLESGIRTRVDESVAWAMSKQELAKPIGHSTTAAGRHGDREAAQTEVTGGGPAPAARAAPATVEAPKVEKPSATPKADPKPEPGRDKTGPRSFEDALASKQPGATAPNASGDGGLPDQPDRAAIAAGLKQVQPRAVACASKNPQAKGMLKITIRIGPDGKVASADIKQSVDPAVDRCAVGVIKTATFPKSKNGMIISYPIAISN